MKIALAGNPNCGKTTLFNALTGGNAHVGNWPGVTVDRREGSMKFEDGSTAVVVDLPGIYSLSPYSPEEVVSRNFILDETPDVIVNIVDATNLERNLYLTTQILETDCPVVVALNMTDIAFKSGVKIDVKLLENGLGVPVVPICALKRTGLDRLSAVVKKTAARKREDFSAIDGGQFKDVYAKIIEIAKFQKIRHAKFQAAKMLEGDLSGVELDKFSARKLEEARASVKLSDVFEGDFGAAIANERYKYITANFSKHIARTKDSSALTASDKIDSILTSRLFGLPIFFAMMFVVFHLTFGEDLFYTAALGFSEDGIPSPGVWMLGLTEIAMEWLSGIMSAGLESAKAAEWVTGLVIDGIMGGLGAVLSFLPQIMMLFLFLSILEDSGYMARAAFLMDRVLRKFGLSGKAFLPLLMCFGCLVPAMMGSRTLENDRERRLTIMLAPFFSCGAKLPIWAMFAMAIFPNNADLTIFLIYTLGIVTAVVTAFILKHTILRGGVSPFIMELPPYHLPMVRNIALNLWDKLKGFIIRASTIIAGATVVIWFLSNFTFSLDMIEANSRESIMGVLGTAVQPLFEPLGFASGSMGWKAIVAALTGLIAKEMVVSTLGVLYTPGAGGDALEDDAASTALAAALVSVFSPLAAVSFMAFNLLSVPCMAAVATANSELRSAKWTWITVAFWIGTAWGVSFLIFQIGSFFGIGV